MVRTSRSSRADTGPESPEVGSSVKRAAETRRIAWHEAAAQCDRGSQHPRRVGGLSACVHARHLHSTHKSTGKDRGAAETVAGVLLGAGGRARSAGAAYIGTAPKNGLCNDCLNADEP